MGSSGTGSETTASTSGASTSTTSSSSASTAASTASTADASTTFLNDVGWGTDVSDTKPEGCKGKIDLLFVIQGHYKFGAAQPQMIDAFPKFISTIEAKFADFDYHIMVVEADDRWGSPACSELCAQPECAIGRPMLPSLTSWRGG